jgi:hypothetical protein
MKPEQYCADITLMGFKAVVMLLEGKTNVSVCSGSIGQRALCNLGYDRGFIFQIAWCNRTSSITRLVSDFNVTTILARMRRLTSNHVSPDAKH